MGRASLTSLEVFKKKMKYDGIETRIKIIHADDIFDYYKDRAIWHVKDLWYRYTEIWHGYVYNENTWWECAEELIQARHYIMGLTALLKELEEWNYKKREPQPDNNTHMGL